MSSPAPQAVSYRGTFSQTLVPRNIPLTLATDASVTGDTASGGFIWTNGQFGFDAYLFDRTATGRDPVLVTELVTIWRAIRAAEQTIAGSTVNIYCDSQNAHRLFQTWRSERHQFPPGYPTIKPDGTHADLVHLASLVKTYPAWLHLRWVPGHRGHPLNEGADTLARIGVRLQQGIIIPEQAKSQANTVAAQALQAFAQSPRSS